MRRPYSHVFRSTENGCADIPAHKKTFLLRDMLCLQLPACEKMISMTGIENAFSGTGADATPSVTAECACFVGEVTVTALSMKSCESVAEHSQRKDVF